MYRRWFSLILGMCPEYNSKVGKIDVFSCSHMPGCPTKIYWSNDVYQCKTKFYLIYTVCGIPFSSLIVKLRLFNDYFCKTFVLNNEKKKNTGKYIFHDITILIQNFSDRS